jgi:uncharacterized protein (TIGR02996 family)
LANKESGMSLLDGFLRDILEHPEDDAPRLILADWLEEQATAYGAGSADLIRTQCRLAPLPQDSLERPALEAREMLLLHGPAQHWASRLRGLVRDWTFHRGLIGEVSVHASQLAAHAGALFGLSPLQRLTLLFLEGHEEAVAARPELAGVRGLRLGEVPWYSPAGEQQAAASRSLSALLDSPWLTGLRELAINRRRLPGGAWNRLARSAWPLGLEVLDLRNTWTTPADLAELLHPARLPRLHTLRLGQTGMHVPPADNPGHRVSASGVAALLPQLRELEADDWGLPEFLSTASQVGLPHLRALRLRHAYRDRTRPSVEALLPGLLAQPWVEQLHALDLAHTNLGPAGAGVLANSPALSNLRSLGLKGTLVTSQGAQALAASPFLGRLHRLDLDFSVEPPPLRYPLLPSRRLGDAGASALAGSAAFAQLRFLSLRRNDVSVSGLRAILAADWLEQLHLLDLRQNRLGDDGANLLLARGPWPNLARLDVKTNQIGPQAKARLRERFGERVWY